MLIHFYAQHFSLTNLCVDWSFVAVGFVAEGHLVKVLPAPVIAKVHSWDVA